MKNFIIFLFGAFFALTVSHAYGTVGCNMSDPDCKDAYYHCAVPFTTENEAVKCLFNVVSNFAKDSFVTCSVTGFSSSGSITVKFKQPPALQRLTEAFAKPCYNIPECAKKFQCVKRVISKR